MTDPVADTRLGRSRRINLRATTRQDELLRRAAEVADQTVTDFVLDSAVDRAQRVLSDLHWFVATDEEHAEFVRLLDAPLPSTEKFERLFSRQSPFAAPE